MNIKTSLFLALFAFIPFNSQANQVTQTKTKKLKTLKDKPNKMSAYPSTLETWPAPAVFRTEAQVANQGIRPLVVRQGQQIPLDQPGISRAPVAIKKASKNPGFTRSTGHFTSLQPLRLAPLRMPDLPNQPPHIQPPQAKFSPPSSSKVFSRDKPAHFKAPLPLPAGSTFVPASSSFTEAPLPTLYVDGKAYKPKEQQAMLVQMINQGCWPKKNPASKQQINGRTGNR